MKTRPALGIYRRLLWLYPRRFRDEFGPDMVQLVANQLRDEHALRVWSRVVVDLLITAPARQLEAHMHRRSTSSVPILFAAISAAGAGLMLIGGTSVGVLAFGAVVAAAAGAIAIVAWRQNATIAAAHLIATHWWKFLVGGAATLIGFAVMTTLTGELGDVTWLVGMIALLSALISLAFGVILAAIHLGGHRRHASSLR